MVSVDLQLAINSLLRLKRAIVYESLEPGQESEDSEDTATEDDFVQQIDTTLSLLGSKLALQVGGSRHFSHTDPEYIWTKLNITSAGFIILKPSPEERIAATTSLGQNELWSSANLYHHLHLLGNVVPQKTEASSRAWIDAFFFRVSAMLPPDQHMVLNMEQVVPAMTIRPLSFPILSGFVDYFAVVSQCTASTDFYLNTQTLDVYKFFKPPSFFIIEAKDFWSETLDHVHQAVCGLYACGQLLQKKILCGALTNGHDWVFLLVKLNDDYDGASYQQSPMIQLQITRGVDNQLVIHEPWPDLIAGILSYWITNSSADLGGDDWFEPLLVAE
ncbi:hypothetical protein EDB92DRAFT_2036180 [Lactarius akahatsu]|uniref:Uncharacterized protein n=1 Tax=Lactarius akahatsu TaxID=416441 RepID=A0AAD4QGA2_9AGAM|nr:hypothetical protein EDB92DRAFT_2036180 [Lactarius akahatsu]